MSIDINAHGLAGKPLAPSLKTLSDLGTFDVASDPRALLWSMAGDFGQDMACIFPGDWAWAALAAPRATRQIWFAVLSGFQDLPEDCTQLRRNLLLLDLDLMMRLRFGNLAEAVRGIVTRLIPHPLQRDHYDELANILGEDASLVAWYEGQTNEIDTMELSDILDYRKELRAEG